MWCHHATNANSKVYMPFPPRIREITEPFLNILVLRFTSKIHVTEKFFGQNGLCHIPRSLANVRKLRFRLRVGPWSHNHPDIFTSLPDIDRRDKCQDPIHFSLQTTSSAVLCGTTAWLIHPFDLEEIGTMRYISWSEFTFLAALPTDRCGLEHYGGSRLVGHVFSCFKAFLKKYKLAAQYI